MLKNASLQIKVLLLSLVFLIPDTIFTKHSQARTGDSVRVAIVFNASLTGYRYRDGIIKALENSKEKYDFNLKIIEKPYIKAPHGEDTIKKLIRDNSVDVILGPTESDVFTKVYNTDGISDNKISVISGLATTDVGNDSQGFFFRLNLESTSRVFEVWSYLSKFWISNIAVIYADSEFGRNAESAFKDLVRVSDINRDYMSVSFESPLIPITDIKKLIDQRPELVGLFCEREDIPRLCRAIQVLNTTGVPYNPYFFTIIDITSVGKGLKNIYFPSLQKYSDSLNINGLEIIYSSFLEDFSDSLKTNKLEDVFSSFILNSNDSLSYIGSDSIYFNFLEKHTNLLKVKDLENVYYDSSQNYNVQIDISKIIKDEVFILGMETGNLLLEALSESGPSNDMRSPAGRLTFRNQVVGILLGESDANLSMNFLKMKNLGPPYLYKMNDSTVYNVKQGEAINWFTISREKIRLNYSIHHFKLILNLILIIIITISISVIEIRRSFPKKHIKVYRTKVFYVFLLTHLLLVIFLYIFLAETGRISYSDTLMTIIISLTPSAFFKTTFFETRSGSSFGLEGVYKRIRAKIDNQIMNARYKKLVGLENVIAYSNSDDSMKRALRRIYRNNPSKIQTSKLIQKLEEDVSQEKDYMNRKRASAKLIMTQFDREQLKAEGFVPPFWDYEYSIDPVILIRYAAKHCAEDSERRDKLFKLLKEELKDLKKRNYARYVEIMSIHDKELSISMSKEGELLVKLRLLMVVHGFNRKWLITKGIISEDQWEQIRISSRNTKANKEIGFGIRFLNKMLMKSRYKKRVNFENFIAYSNSIDSMKNALLGVYRYNPSSGQELRLIKMLEDKMSYGKDFMDRKRIVARLLVKQFNKTQLISEGFVPIDWDYDETINPEILIRFTAKLSADDEIKHQKVADLLDNEFKQLKKRNPKTYVEIMSFYKKEISNMMTKEGELLVKIQMLFIFQNFNIEWMIENGIILEEWLGQIRKSSKSNTSNKTA